MTTKERPILFSGEMVRAILNGRKTQTRRVIKSSIVDFHTLEFMHLDHDESPWIAWFESGRVQDWVKCPYGQVGDRLWVRESWGVGKPMDSKPASRMRRKPRSIWYDANGERPDWAGKCRPSIFMPRWASRITLEITGVRVERLNDISEADAKSEGCPAPVYDDLTGTHQFQGLPFGAGPRQWFCSLWLSINGADSWAANPWVWVIAFRRIDA